MNRSKSFLLICVAVGVAAFTGSTSASGATTYGDDLAADPLPQANLALVIARGTAGGEDPGFPAAGVVTKLLVKTTGSGGTVTALVVRPQRPLPGPFYNATTVAIENIDVTPDISSAGHVTEKAVRIPVLAGDTLGLGAPSTIGMSRTLISSAQTCGWINLVDVPAVGASGSYNNASCNSWWPAIQAHAEPDADADGFGDETQDQCPSSASTAGACPPPIVAITAVRSKAKTASSATRSFVIKNTGGTAAALVPVSVKSSKKVKNLKIVKGCKPGKNKSKCTLASLAPGASVTIKVSLSIKAATKTVLTATAGTAKATSTVKLKAKKK